MRWRHVDAGKLWTAPEILRQNNPPRGGTQRADVYSYAIICYEIMMRTEPYNFDNITPRGTPAVRGAGCTVPTSRGVTTGWTGWKMHASMHNRFTSCIASHYQCQRRNNLLVFRGTLLSQLFSDQNAQLGSKRKGLRRLFLMDSSFTVNEVQNYVTCRCRRRYREFFKAV